MDCSRSSSDTVSFTQLTTIGSRSGRAQPHIDDDWSVNDAQELSGAWLDVQGLPFQLKNQASYAVAGRPQPGGSKGGGKPRVGDGSAFGDCFEDIAAIARQRQ